MKKFFRLKKSKKIIVSVMGGVGDQTFQFIFANYLKNKFQDSKIYLDTTYYSLKNHNFKIRLKKLYNSNISFKKNIFLLNFNKISYLRFLRNFNFLNYKVFNIKIDNFIYEYWNKKNYKEPNLLDNSYYFGYWHNIKYFKAIKKNLIFSNNIKKNTKLKKIYNQFNSSCVSLHIRGGDFLNNIHAKILDHKYYLKSKNYINKKIKNPKFYIFTNDEKYALQIIKKIHLNNFFFINKYKLEDYEEFFLLTKFKNIISSNSTFSLASSLLASNIQNITMPYNWYNNANLDQKRYIDNAKVIK